MSKTDLTDLIIFLKPFPEKIRETVLAIRAIVWDWYPGANELIYDNYNALAFGWSLSDKQIHLICTIAVYSKHLHFGFYHGNQINDPDQKLSGKGNQYRYIVLQDLNDFPKTYMKKRTKEAYAYVKAMLILENKQQSGKAKHNMPVPGSTIIKSVSAKKRRPA